MFILGICLAVYGLFCLIIGIFKIPAIWNMGKIKAFIKILGDLGTQIFILVWGAIALGVGIYFIINNMG